MEDAVIDGISATKPDWPTLGGANMRSAGLRMLVATALGGDYGRIRRAWLSLLLPVGHVVRRKGETSQLMVTWTSSCGFAAWRVRMRKDGDIGRLDFGAEGEHCLVYGAVEDIPEWEVVNIKACPPPPKRRSEQRRV